MNDSGIKQNRKSAKYSPMEQAWRVCWGFGKLFFRFSPKPLFAWRRWLLRRFGADIGSEVHVYNSALIYFPWNLTVGAWSAIGEGAVIYNLGKVKIGSSVTISQRAHLCAGTHDYLQLSMPLLKPPIEIADHVWICADAFIGPGVAVGQGAIVGARAVATKDVDPWVIVGGNPAKVIRKRSTPI